MGSNTEYRAQTDQQQKASSEGLTQLTRPLCSRKHFKFVLKELSPFWAVKGRCCCLSPWDTQAVILTRQ